MFFPLLYRICVSDLKGALVSRLLQTWQSEVFSHGCPLCSHSVYVGAATRNCRIAFPVFPVSFIWNVVVIFPALPKPHVVNVIHAATFWSPTLGAICCINLLAVACIACRSCCSLVGVRGKRLSKGTFWWRLLQCSNYWCMVAELLDLRGIHMVQRNQINWRLPSSSPDRGSTYL